MNDADIMVCIAALDSRRMRGGDRRSEEAKSKASSDAIENAPSKSAAQTAELLGTSTSKVERCRTVMQNGDPETIEEVKQGKKSINKAATELREKRKAEKDNTEIKEPTITESNETNLQPKKKAVDKEFSVALSKEHYERLQELGGSVEEHVQRAIDRYIYMLIESGEIEINPDEYDD
jgi:hypothetical protein